MFKATAPSSPLMLMGKRGVLKPRVSSSLYRVSGTPYLLSCMSGASIPFLQQQHRTSATAQFLVDHDPSEIKKRFRTMLQNEREQAKLGGGMARIQKQHKRGSLTARERLELLFDNNTFHELDQLKSHRCTEFDMDKKKFPGDGIGT
jgi:Carboxyl transferase domain